MRVAAVGEAQALELVAAGTDIDYVGATAVELIGPGESAGNYREVEFKDGKRKITPKKVFPGYVLVEMDMDDGSWYVVRNTSGVTGFVGSPGSGEKPVPLQDKEVKTILKQMGIETPKLKIDFAKGDRIKVTSGPFFDFTGIVDDIQPEKEKVRALISIFGRETPVELEFGQIEKIS